MAAAPHPTLAHSLRRSISAASALLLSLFMLSAHGQTPQTSTQPGCQKPATSGLFTRSTVDGKAQARTYLVQIPSAYTPSHAYPVVFVFHASGGDAKQSYSWGLQRASGAAEAAIFAFPNGLPFQRYGVGWDDRTDGYDLPFFDNMLKDLAASYCTDAQRVFAAGFSWGGDFVVALACHRGDVVLAAAANSTDDEFKDTKNYLTYLGLPCASHKHPAIRFEHAEDGDSSYPPPDFATTSQLLRHLNRCGQATASVPSSAPGTKCIAYDACTSSYVECIFDKRMGHSLPPNWAQDTWTFFASFM